MPVVILRHEKYGRAQWFYKELAKALTEIAADALDATKDDIIVASTEHSEKYDHGVNGKDFEVYIVLHAYKVRIDNLPTRLEQIRSRIRDFLDNLPEGRGKEAEGFVWLLPVESAFAKI